MPPSPPTAQQRANFDYLVLTSLVLVSWELLLHFFQDLAYLRTKGWYRRPVMWAYFLQRYGAFAVLVAQANIRLGKPPSCYAAGMVSLVVGGVIVLPSISLIYLYRVLAIWNKRAEVKYTLIGLWVVLLGASITAPFSQSAGNLPNGSCTVTRSEVYTPASFIANAVYDGAVFILTLIKLVANRQQYKNFRSPVQTMLLRDGILYFGVAVAVSITDIVFLEAIKSPVIASTVIPLHIGLTSIMTTRLVNNVFQVLTHGSNPQFFSNTSDAMRQTPGTAIPSKIHRGKIGGSATILIGSGVGTEHFDDPSIKPQRLGGSDQGSDIDIGSGKVAAGHTYSVPMQVKVTRDEDQAV